MLLGIDHLVVVVADLAAASSDYSKLGFAVVPGGRHPIGSSNSLIAFADKSYIELIAFDAAAQHPWKDSLAAGGGIVDYCMQTDDLDADAARFRKAGVAMQDTYPLTRVRPDGFRLEWLLAVPAHPGAGPFLIKDITPREQRVPSQCDHTNGAIGIANLVIAARDLASSRALFAALTESIGREILREELNAQGFSFQIGTHSIQVLAPHSPSSPLTQAVGNRPRSVYMAELSSKLARPSLDLSKTHSARLSLVGS
jgi:hypothetical protein